MGHAEAELYLASLGHFVKQLAHKHREGHGWEFTEDSGMIDEEEGLIMSQIRDGRKRERERRGKGRVERGVCAEVGAAGQERGRDAAQIQEE